MKELKRMLRRKKNLNVKKSPLLYCLKQNTQIKTKSKKKRIKSRGKMKQVNNNFLLDKAKKPPKRAQKCATRKIEQKTCWKMCTILSLISAHFLGVNFCTFGFWGGRVFCESPFFIS